MKEDDCPPNASMLMESTRSVGYKFESAIADIIDNSISADATNIHIKSIPSEDPYVAILDDGNGLSDSELQEAMRYGADPNMVRSEKDLGRFGLGLKMASLSQCRRLTVVSVKGGGISARRWDLDRVVKSNRWILQILERQDLTNLPMLEELNGQQSGTLVIWENIDRASDQSESIEETMVENLDITRQHLSLTFHRFMDEEPGISKKNIFVNGSPIEPIDPFLSKNPKTQQFPEEIIRYGGNRIALKAFILPHPSKLTATDYKLLGGKDTLTRLQGFYVYRNKRLIVPGTWFRLTAVKELRNLARVRVDIPNSTDFEWEIDIKKSTASIPLNIRSRFVKALDNVTSTSERKYIYRGERVRKENTYVWDKITNRDNYRYVINRDHPVILNIKEGLDADYCRRFESLLELIEQSVPYSMINNDLDSGKSLVPERSEEIIEDRIFEVCIGLLNNGLSFDKLSKTEPFFSYPEILKKLRLKYDA